MILFENPIFEDQIRGSNDTAWCWIEGFCLIKDRNLVGGGFKGHLPDAGDIEVLSIGCEDSGYFSTLILFQVSLFLSP